MPTTSAGTRYTAHTWTNSTGDPCIWGVADRVANNPYPRPVLLFCHGSGSEYDHFTTSIQYRELRNRVIDNGWAYVEARGGNTSHWGREYAMESYAAALQEAAQEIPLGTVVAYGRSMGGTVATSLAVKPQWGISQHVVGLLLESAVQSLYYWHVTRGKGLNGQYPEGRVSEGGDPAVFAAASEPFDPLKFDVSLFESMPVLFIHGDEDTTVMLEGNAEAQYNRIKNVAPYAELVVREGGTHNVGDSNQPEVINPAWRFLRQAQGLLPTQMSLELDGSTINTGASYVSPGWIQAEPLSSPSSP